MTPYTALSVGFPGLLKSSFTPLMEAHGSKLLEQNSGPLSTRIVLGVPRAIAPAPATVSRSGKPQNAAGPTLGHRCARLGLPERECNLLFRKVLLPH